MLIEFLTILFLLFIYFGDYTKYKIYEGVASMEELEENVENNIVTIEGLVQDVEEIKKQITVLTNQVEQDY
tara:strand:+ start:1383 stop:1595 length:213 start_codon:yes stop_codon:yes gene_type:complete